MLPFSSFTANLFSSCILSFFLFLHLYLFSCFRLQCLKQFLLTWVFLILIFHFFLCSPFVHFNLTIAYFPRFVTWTPPGLTKVGVEFLFAIGQKKWRYPYSYGVSWTSDKKYFCNIMAIVGHTFTAKCKIFELWSFDIDFCHLNIEYTCHYIHFKLLVSFLGSKTKILQPLL